MTRTTLLLLAALLSGCADLAKGLGYLEDDDGDGFTEVDGDCDDADSDINPNGSEGEHCDGFDNDCDLIIDNGLTKNFYPDTDYDTFGDKEAEPSIGCMAESMVSNSVENNNDCDDTRRDVHPEAEEVCGDGVDNDCRNGDETCPVDPEEGDETGDTAG